MTRKTGRPSKLTEDMKKKVLGLIRAGNYPAVVCRACDIDETTYINWKKRAKKEEEMGERGEFFRFFQEIKKAEAEAEAMLVAKVSQDESWQAKMTMLERRHPERWGRKDSLRVGNDGDQPFVLQIVTHTKDEHTEN